MATIRAPLMAAICLVFTLTFGSLAPVGAQEAPQLPSPVLLYAQILRHINPKLAIAQCRDFASEVLRDAEKAHLDPQLVVAIVTVESHWNSRAVSHSGARGLGQLMPGTAAQLGVDPRSPHQNLRGTSAYLSTLVKKFEHDPRGLSLAIGAYNAGPKAVERYNGIPPYQETQTYVKRVLRVMSQLRHRVPAAALAAQTLQNQAGHGDALRYWLPADTAARAPAEHDAASSLAATAAGTASAGSVSAAAASASAPAAVETP